MARKDWSQPQEAEIVAPLALWVLDRVSTKIRGRR